MNCMLAWRWRLLASVVVILALLIGPSMVFAVGTGDDPAPAQDTLCPTDASVRQADAAQFQEWLSGSGSMGAEGSGGSRYLWTPSHAQERSYWCGPASVQIVSHYFWRWYSQSTIAAWMGTTTNGTTFSLVDDTLRHFSTIWYFYYGPITTWDAYVANLRYGIIQKGRPVLVDVNIDGDKWPYYINDHAGHILPIEAFDMTYTPYKLRVNDPYNEAAWQGGGSTYGHQNYPAYIIWWGLQAHWRHALVR